MNHCILALTIAALVCGVVGEKKPQQEKGVSDLDIKNVQTGASYCNAGKCTVKAGTTVKITFTVNVEADHPISARPWTAKVSQGKVVFSNWNACVEGGEIVLQQAACASSNIAPGAHPGHAIAPLETATMGHLIVGNAQPYMSAYLEVTVD